MTGVSVYKDIKQVVEKIDKEVESVSSEDLSARDIISRLDKDGGGIEVIGDGFEPIEEDVSVIKERVGEAYDKSYGLDGSTTKDLSFNNGLVLSVSVASTGVVGTDTLGETSKKSTVSVSIYFEKEDININFDTSDNTRVLYQQYPVDRNNSNKVSDWLTDLSRMNSEGTHLKQISNDIDAPIFVDGSILPSTLMIWTALDNMGRGNNTPMNEWSSYIWSCLQYYIDGIEGCVKNSVPIYGVQKSTTSTRVIDAISEKSSDLDREDIVWTNDGTLFNSALNPETDGSIISYTPWYIEKTFKINNIDKNIPPLKGYKSVNLEFGSYKDYMRAFFFVKPPTDTTVYRIGVPKIVFNYMSRDMVRDIALNEMIKQYSEPLPIVVADQKVRIPKTLRDRLRRVITSESHKGKNEQREYK